MSDEIIIKEVQQPIRERAIKVGDNNIKVMEEIYANGEWVITKTEYFKLDVCKKLIEQWAKEVISK